MIVIKTKDLTDEQFAHINHLWNEDYPLKLKDRFPLLLDGVENYNHYLVRDENEKVLGWAVHFEKDGEQRFSVIVDENEKGRGLGTLLITQLMADVGEFYGWLIDHNNDVKANGEKYMSPLMFYKKLGFEIIENQRVDNDIIKAVKIKYTTK